MSSTTPAAQDPNDHPSVKIAPPILALVHLVIAFVLGWLLPIMLPDWVAYAGIALVIGGMVLAFLALNQLVHAQTSPDPYAPTTAVVTSGVYQYSRNPIYVGYLCAVMGFPLLIGSPWGLFTLPLQLLLFNKLVIEFEEKYLAQKFGQAYAAYTESVRRWL